jgi:YT521-B-like domain
MCVYNFLPTSLLTCYFQREIKVSRDGTEIEPTIGQLLIDEWEKNEPPAGPSRAGETATSSLPTAPLPRSAGGRTRSMRNAPLVSQHPQNPQ